MFRENQGREEPLYRFEKNSREEVRASLSNFQGHDLIDLRVLDSPHQVGGTQLFRSHSV